MKTIFIGPYAMYPVSPAQRFVDHEGNDITDNVTADVSGRFEKRLRALVRHRFVVIDIGEILEAVRAMFGDAIPGEEDHEDQFGASYVPGNTTKH